ncbi:hypothetical protein ACVV4G_25735 [Escherichia coli]
MHVRPASRLVYTLSTFNADMLLEKTANALHRRVLTRLRYYKFAITIRCA